MIDRIVAVRKDEGEAFALADRMRDAGFDVYVKQSRQGGFRLKVPGGQADRAKKWIDSNGRG